MSRVTRKEFLGLGAAAGVGVGLGAGLTRRAGAAVPEGALDAAPDLVLVNGRVFTVDDDAPRAEAFAVKHGRFVAVGSSDDVRNLAGSSTVVVDAEGMTVTPGFIDAHTHPAWGGVAELVNVNCDLRSIEDIKAALRKRAAETPAGGWVLGFKYDDTKVREGRQITIDDLDAAVPEHPVHVNHRGGHTSWYNSKAFAIAGITARTPDPPGGHIDQANGRLTGRVAETANDLLTKHIPSESSRAQRREGVKVISEMMTAAGLTAGKLADFVILGDDPHEVDPDRIKEIPIVRTVVGGETMYEA